MYSRPQPDVLASTYERPGKPKGAALVTSWSNLHAARFGVSICFCTADYFLTEPPFDFDEPIVPETRMHCASENAASPGRLGDLNKFIICEWIQRLERIYVKI